MVTLIKLLGIVIVILTVTFMTKPAMIKKYIAFWTKDKRVYVGAVISILFGIMFLRAASACTISWVIFLIGIWALVKGVILWSLGPKKLEAKCSALTKLPPKTLRLIMLISLAMGILIIYAA